MGRTTKTIENYVDGTVGDDNDKTTEYTYNAAGMTTLKALLTGGAFQTTEWVYGITQAGGHGIDSNDVVRATRWPDPTTGAASAGQQETVTLDALGRTWNSVDRNGTEHRLTYDPLGRVVLDTVKNWGSATDITVDRIATAYDGQGNAFRMTSLAPTSDVVNEVVKEFNGFGQMTVEYQSHEGPVDPNGTPKVQYGYDDAANTNSNHARLTTVTYPRGRKLEYLYEGFDDSISRLSALHDAGSSTRMEEYQYLGAGTVVRRTHPESGIDLSYVKLGGEPVGDAGDQYTGLDRFGRIVDQRWLTAANGVAVDRYQYNYDRNGNRTSEVNALNTSLNETYGYDSLNQLTNFSTTGTTKSWDFDALGNWDGVTTNGTTQTRSHNRQNEITGVSGATTPTFDSVGNMTTDETGKQYVYDAWNRLVLVKNSGGTDLVRYEYDGLTRRVKERNFQSSTPKQNDLYYSAQWQVIEERPESGKATLTYVWSPVYVDAMVARDKDADGSGDGIAEERLYALHDANFNVTAITQSNGSVAERYTYDPFGTATPRDAAWTVTTPAYGWQYLHQGGRFNAESGLYSFRYREYSPTLGRWVTMDPIGYESGEKSLYVAYANSSTNNIDFMGLCSDQSCGEEIWPLLKKGFEKLEKEWAALSTTKKLNICSSIATLVGWDISQLYRTGATKERSFFSNNGCGTGDCAKNVTVNGNCYNAGEVNYLLWGYICRLCNKFFDEEGTIVKSRYDPRYALMTRVYTFKDGTRVTKSALGREGTPYDLNYALESIPAFRKFTNVVTGNASDFFSGDDIKGRKEWTKVGFSLLKDGLPTGRNLNAACSPCKSEYKGALSFIIGRNTLDAIKNDSPGILEFSV